MLNEAFKKVESHHLERNAYLYIRQSTLRQVHENTESTKRQYALKSHASSLGWAAEKIIVIDSDLGQSGASSENREGFKKLVSEVGMGNAGIVMGLEVSRLARNSSDWHRLLEICALTKTLILDEEGLYDPADFNDRLLLGLKGTMSEAELHMIKMRMRGGILAKAKRGELQFRLPTGLVFNELGKIIRDPDKQVQESIFLVFKTFRQLRAANAVVKYFKENEIKLPTKIFCGENKGEIIWQTLGHSKILRILHNPMYTGAYIYGRTKYQKLVNGKSKIISISQEKWCTIIKGVHDGYISWEEYMENQKILKANAQLKGADRRQSPPREGSALLQGLVICGKCGRRMKVQYNMKRNNDEHYYICDSIGKEFSIPFCQRVNGRAIGEAISKILLEIINPLTLEITIKIQEELNKRFEEIKQYKLKQVERVQYEANLARRRFMQVDPDNRLVADTLEAEWNNKLKELRTSKKEYDEQIKKEMEFFGEEEIKKILSLASDFSELWNKPGIVIKDKKQMLRFLIEDITINKLADRSINVHVRFKGGAVKSIQLDPPVFSCDLRRTKPDIVNRIDKLINDYTDKEIANILNQEGIKTGTGLQFCAKNVLIIRFRYRLKSCYDRLREKKFLKTEEVIKMLKINRKDIFELSQESLIESYKYDDRNSRLYKIDMNNLYEKLKNNSKYQKVFDKISKPLQRGVV